jgi:hypothetical protein
MSIGAGIAALPRRGKLDQVALGHLTDRFGMAAAVAMLALVLTVITGAGSSRVPVAMRRSSHCCEPAVEPGKHCEAELDPIAAVRPLKGQAKHGAEEAIAVE